MDKINPAINPMCSRMDFHLNIRFTPYSVIGRTALHHFPVHDGKEGDEQEHAPADGSAISEIVVHEGFAVQVEDDGHPAAAYAAVIADQHLRLGEDLHAADG